MNAPSTNAQAVARLMSLIPERTPRVQLGAAFELSSTGCRYPERLEHLSKFLHWMSPLVSLTREDEQILGLRNALGRPVHAADLEDEEMEGGPEKDVFEEGVEAVADPEPAAARIEAEEEEVLA